MSGALSVDKAKSGRSKCRHTQQKIPKGELRIGKEVPNTYTGFGTTTAWYSMEGAEELVRQGRMSIRRSADLAGYARLSTANKMLVDQMVSRANAPAAPQSPKASSVVVNGGAGVNPSPAKARISEKDAQAVLNKMKSSGLTSRGTIAKWMEGESLEQGVSRIEYARVKKPSDCMVCRGNIRRGDIRIGDAQPSKFYYGMQTRWMCMRCGIRRVSKYSQLKGWDRMGYDVSREIRTKTLELMSPEEEAALEAVMQPVSDLWDVLIMELNEQQMIALLKINHIKAEDMRIEKAPINMGLFLADAMCNGLCEDCVVCQNPSLVGLSGRVVCWGFMGGLTKCVARSDLSSVQRYALRIPQNLADADWLKEWMKSHEHCMHVDPSAPALPESKKRTPKKNNNKKKKQNKNDDAKKKETELVVEGYDLSFKKMKKADLVSLLNLRGRATKGTVARLKQLLAQAIQEDSTKPVTEALPNLSDASSYTLNVLELECRVRGVPAASSKATTADSIRNHHAEAAAKIQGVAAATASMNTEAGGKKEASGRKRSREEGDTGDGKEHEGSMGLPNAKKLKLKPVEPSKLATIEEEKEEDLKVEKRPAPDDGSPILEVHERYPHHYLKPKIVVDNDGHDVYNAVMTQVELGTGFNRFYVVQLIKAGQKYHVFCHWGRTGSQGAEWACSWSRSDMNVYEYSSRNRAVEEFKKWFLKKTDNKWDRRFNFKPKPQCYYWGELSRKNNEKAKKRVIKTEDGGSMEVESKLPEETRSLVELLFDEDTIIGSMKESGVKVEEMPLGAVTVERIKRGNDSLHQIRLLLEKKGQPGVDPRVFQSQLKMLSTEFYNLIPAVDPKLIDNQEFLQKKSDLVNLLSDIALGQNLLAKGKSKEHMLHPTDEKFNSLNCKMKKVERDTMEWKTIDRYLRNTAKPPPNAFLSGSRYGKVPEILEIFEVERQGASTRFSEHKDVQNRKLLWHGTNIAVVAAILSSGLRIMPNAGGRVGKGLYFAAENCKSSYYVSAAHKCGTGIMFLAEVAMGKEFSITAERSYLKKAPAGFDSVVAQGVYDPDPKDNVTFKIEGNDVMVPAGKAIVRNQYKTSNFQQSEYLIYKESQQQLRYLIKLKMS